MAEKGGIGCEDAKVKKSSPKSPAGKDDISAKQKKVQFDAEDSFENITSASNGNVDTPTAEGVKEEKTAKKLEVPSLAERQLEEEAAPPQGAKCLMDCEVAEALQGIKERMALLSQDPMLKLPEAFLMTLPYAKRGGNYAKSGTIKKILEPLKKHGVSDVEICQIANIGPESVDNMVDLVPSLKPRLSDIREPLRIALAELSNLKETSSRIKDPNVGSSSA